MNRSLSGLKLRAGVGVNPDLIADRNWPIPLCLGPFACSAGLKRNRTIEETQAGDARRRILPVFGRVVIAAGAVLRTTLRIVLHTGRRVVRLTIVSVT